MKTIPRPPKREAEDPPPCVKWVPRELTEEGATCAVLNGLSLLVLGIAGVGKTHSVQELVKKFRDAGKCVDIISKTHTASQRAGEVTADHYVRRHLCTARVPRTTCGLMNFRRCTSASCVS